MRTSVLLVSDDKERCFIWRRILSHLRPTWEFHFASDAAGAMDHMASTAVDVIVKTLLKPEAESIQLLSRIETLYPNCIRLALCDHSVRNQNFRSLDPSHQCLSEPCDADRLVETIERACGVFSRLHDTRLQEIISRIDCLPSLPENYFELLREVKSEETSVGRLSNTFGNDLGLCSKVLHLANIALSGLPQHVSCPEQAVSLVGSDVIRQTTLSKKLFRRFDDPQLFGYSLEQANAHGLLVGSIARNIVESESSDESMAKEAFIAGFMHDIGKLVFAVHLPELFEEASKLTDAIEQPLWRAEMAVFGTTHAAVGAHLLGLWGLPNSIVEAVALHHQPNLASNNRFSLLTAVHMANAISHQAGKSVTYRTERPWDEEYLDAIGCNDRVEHWAACGDPRGQIVA